MGAGNGKRAGMEEGWECYMERDWSKEGAGIGTRRGLEERLKRDGSSIRSGSGARMRAIIGTGAGVEEGAGAVLRVGQEQGRSKGRSRGWSRGRSMGRSRSRSESRGGIRGRGGISGGSSGSSSGQEQWQ